MMRRHAPACLCLALAATAAAQNHVVLPATANPSAELPNYTLLPFMQPNARVQAFYDAAEVGTAPLLADQLEFRYDGPLPQVGAPGPFTITRLQIRVGVTSVANPGASFAANLTQPLTTVFDGPWTYLPDSGAGFPHPWGGPSGTLTFPFTSIAPITVGPGQWLVIDLTMEGNNISSFGFAHALLDGAATSGGPTTGTATSYGAGCSAATGAPAATASVTGLLAPGGAHHLGGQNLGANTIALGVFGFSNSMAFAPLPFNLPGTACNLLASLDLTVPVTTDANGAVAGTAAIPLVVPADPTFAGIVLYEQMASLVATANPWGIVLSDAVAVNLGTWNTPGRGTWLCSHDSSHTSPNANAVRAFGLGARLRTL